MLSTPHIDVNHAHRKLVSFVAGLAVALTFFRFGAARIQAQRAAQADPAA